MTYNSNRVSSDLKLKHLITIFYSVFSTSDDSLVTDIDHQSSSPTLDEIDFSNSDVLDLLTTLDASKACGIDNFSPKCCASPLLQVICHLFRASLSVPYHKTVVLTILSLFINLEISLLLLITDTLSSPRFWKEECTINIRERVKQVSTKCQFCFLPKRSTLQQLLLFVKHVFRTKV